VFTKWNQDVSAISLCLLAYKGSFFFATTSTCGAHPIYSLIQGVPGGNVDGNNLKLTTPPSGNESQSIEALSLSQG
jgi:hypothetical protein